MGESASVGVVEACVSPCRPDENLAKDVADEGGDGGSTCQAARERGFQVRECARREAVDGGHLVGAQIADVENVGVVEDEFGDRVRLDGELGSVSGCGGEAARRYPLTMQPSARVCGVSSGVCMSGGLIRSGWASSGWHKKEAKPLEPTLGRLCTVGQEKSAGGLSRPSSIPTT